jgi:hypothetical protein
MGNRSRSLRREIDIMLASAVLEAPEREFDEDAWDDEDLDADELDVELDDEGLESEDDEDF